MDQLVAIDDASASSLLLLPESGMGFQLLELAFDRDSTPTPYFVLNASIALRAKDSDDLVTSFKSLQGRIGSGNQGHSWHSIVKTFSRRLRINSGGKSSISLLASRLLPELSESPRWSKMVGEQSLIAIPSTANPTIYYRYSAFIGDLRIDSTTGGFLPGTYATTFADSALVPSGFAAVGRYALPSPLPASFVYPLLTTEVPTQVGTVVPNFGQAGGGVEVCFQIGAKPCWGAAHKIADS